MTRVRQTGRDSWQARSGYRYHSAPHTKLERPAGEPPLLGGVLLLIAMFTIGALLVAMLP